MTKIVGGPPDGVPAEGTPSSLLKAGEAAEPVQESLFGTAELSLAELTYALGGIQESASRNPARSVPPAPVPFSPQCAGIDPSLFTDPNRLWPALGSSASSHGVTGFLNSLDTGAVSKKVDNLMSEATREEQDGNSISAEQDMIKAQIMFRTVSQLLSAIGMQGWGTEGVDRYPSRYHLTLEDCQWTVQLTPGGTAEISWNLNEDTQIDDWEA